MNDLSAALVRDDQAALVMAERAGLVIPPLYEVTSHATGVNVQRLMMGFVVFDFVKEAPAGFLIMVPSADLRDYEIIAEGGWRVNGARRLFRMIFDEMGQARVSTRCLAGNERNIRVLTRMGFREEGRRRMPGGPDHILFGMTREECRLLKLKEDAHGCAQAA